MPGQRQKGKKNIRRFKVRIELIEPGKDDEIAVIENTHGGRPPRFSCRTINDDLINAPIQGSIAKGPRRVLVKKGDFVLLSKLECSSSDSYYIHHVYTKNDVKELEKKGLLKKVKKVDEDEKTFLGARRIENGRRDGCEED